MPDTFKKLDKSEISCIISIIIEFLQNFRTRLFPTINSSERPKERRAILCRQSKRQKFALNQDGLIPGYIV